ncbi:dihydrofolate reductase-like isoform X3 [Hyposmocoma kahamanoa]|uniref:dihydrofolate reductase-like isoform X3 n=1 Tax=Hyposmocoma kahamanoa TaxID=1477025 RepID=UPI000E6D653E|nr:dihydrofolate reductase-like isoform X3 [Hyposmocoma kahamanoa]
MSKVKLNLIAAACDNMGIGVNGTLPWRLKNEMAYFSKMTSGVTDSSKKNAVIMGRQTYDCIPDKYRPLSGRVNIVLTRSVEELKKRRSMVHPACDKIYLTEIQKSFECDTFFPSIDHGQFVLVTEDGVPQDLQQEGDTPYYYRIYKKCN